MPNPNNVFEAILKYGHDEDFYPKKPTTSRRQTHRAGSDEKIEVLRQRVELGLPPVAFQRSGGLQRPDRGDPSP